MSLDGQAELLLAEATRSPNPDQALRHLANFASAVRRPLPWFELLLARLGGTPLHDRQGLLHSARRVLTAAHPGLPIDRLLWLAMRRHFGENPYALVHEPAEAEIAQLPPADMRHVADYTAHLARMVPSDDPAAGQRWYAAVLGRWLAPRANAPPAPVPLLSPPNDTPLGTPTPARRRRPPEVPTAGPPPGSRASVGLLGEGGGAKRRLALPPCWTRGPCPPTAAGG